MKHSIIKFNNAPLDNPSPKFSTLNSHVNNESILEEDIRIKTQVYFDENFVESKIITSNTITITIPEMRVIDGKSSIYFALKPDFLNIIINKYSLYYKNEGNHVYIQSACENFFDMYIQGKWDSNVTCVYDYNSLVNKWHTYIPSFSISVRLPFFYNNKGSEYRSYNYKEYLVHEIDFVTDISKILSVKALKTDEKYLTKYIFDSIYVPDGNIKIPTMKIREIHISDEERIENDTKFENVLVCENYINIYSAEVEPTGSINITITNKNISSIYLSAYNITLYNLGLGKHYNNGTRCIISGVTMNYEDGSKYYLSYIDILSMMALSYNKFRKDILEINFTQYKNIISSDITENSLESISVHLDDRSLIKIFNQDTDNYMKRLSNSSSGSVDLDNISRRDEQEDRYTDIYCFSHFYDENKYILDEFDISSTYHLSAVLVERILVTDVPIKD